jgi:TPR repeat protein
MGEIKEEDRQKSLTDDECLVLALNYRVKNDIENAQKYLFKAYERGNKRAITHLLFAYYFRGWGLETDDQKLLEMIDKVLLSSNHMVAVFFRALLLQKEGKTEESIKWANRVDKTLDPLAKGLCCYYEIGENNRLSKAKLYLKKAAKEQKDEYAYYMLGFYYEHIQKINKSIKWFGKAAAQGNACAFGALYIHHIESAKKYSGLMILHNHN